MFAYTAETGHVMDWTSVVAQTTPEDVAREMARRSFGIGHPGVSAKEIRDTYTVTDHGIVRSGAQRFTVSHDTTAPDALTVFIGTREEVDALVW